MYRKRTLQQALRVYDRLLDVHRPKEWHIMGGAPKEATLLASSSPQQQILNMMRKVAEEEAQSCLKFKIVERVGAMIRWDLHNTNQVCLQKAREKL